MQILEDGRLTDGRGDTTYFSETIIVFTSNLGIYVEDAQGQRVFEHYLLGHSVKAIAAAEGVTEQAITAAIRRGLENMKKYLEKVL